MSHTCIIPHLWESKNNHCLNKIEIRHFRLISSNPHQLFKVIMSLKSMISMCPLHSRPVEQSEPGFWPCLPGCKPIFHQVERRGYWTKGEAEVYVLLALLRCICKNRSTIYFFDSQSLRLLTDWQHNWLLYWCLLTLLKSFKYAYFCSLIISVTLKLTHLKGS